MHHYLLPPCNIKCLGSDRQICSNWGCEKLVRIHVPVYLAVVELLNDGLVLLADVTHADELGFAVSLEETLTESLDHCGS